MEIYGINASEVWLIGENMKMLLQVLQLVPVIVSIVKSFEDAIPLPQQGKTKLDAILAIVQQVSGNLAGELVPSVTKIVTIVVDMFNKTGVFKK